MKENEPDPQDSGHWFGDAMEENVMNGKVLWNAIEGKTIQKRKPASRSQVVKWVLMTAGVFVYVVFFVGAMASTLYAQSYPSKPVRLILPYPAGGATDILGRLVGQKLAEQLGQPFVPENRPGAAGNIGTEIVAKAKPDGYIILFHGSSITSSPALYKKLNYDPINDLAPISLAMKGVFVLLVRPSLPVKSLKELVEYAKARPGKLNFGAPIGGLPHVASELFNTLSNIKITHVPYKGAVEAMTGMMSNEIDIVVSATPAALPLIHDNRVRALAVLSEQRDPSLPNVPTAKEAGIDNFEVIAWCGIWAPAGTPSDIISSLNAKWVKIAAMPDTIEKAQKFGFKPTSNTPMQFAQFIKTEIVRWTKVIKDANISAN
jgi:tripartite-type tricarboxylate transporter receptor subunit TctC